LWLGFGGLKNLRFLTYVHPGGQSLEGDFSTLAAAVEAWSPSGVRSDGFIGEKSMVGFPASKFLGGGFKHF